MKTSGGQLAVRIGDFYVFMQNLIFKTLDSIVENNKLARSIVTLWLKTDEMNCAAWWQIVWYSDEKRKISEKLDNLKSSILEVSFFSSFSCNTSHFSTYATQILNFQ